MGELLQELRVVLPGLQVLFAFLLVVPFSARFESVSQLQQAVFFGTLVCTTLSAGLFLAPAAHHRLLWRQQVKERRLQQANKLVIWGMILLVAAMAGALFLITDFLFGSMAATVLTVSTITACLVSVWFMLPVWYRLNDK